MGLYVINSSYNLYISECNIEFRIQASATPWRQGVIFINGKEALPWVTNGIHLAVIGKSCEVTETVNFRLLERAAEYYDSLSRGTFIVGMGTGNLGTIIQRKFGQVFEKEPTPFKDYMFPFIVKKDFDGIGNHSIVTLKGEAVTWGMKIYLGE